MKLFYQEYGTGHPLVILHGLLGSLDNWHTISKLLGQSFRVIAVDQRNHGRSPHSEEMTYDAMAQDIMELLERLHLPSAFVLGHSMGGKAAMHIALRSPHRVDRLIAVDIAPRSYPPLHDEIFDALTSVDLASCQSRQQVDDALSFRIKDFAVRQFLIKNLARNPRGEFSWKANIRVLERSYPEISREIDSATPFHKPALFVKGARSSYVAESDTRHIQRLFPQTEIVTIDAGHWIHAEAPDQFAEVVSRFLKSEHSSR